MTSDAEPVITATLDRGDGVHVERMRDFFVYLSGPITPRGGVLAEDNVVAALRVHLDLLRRGVPNFCPQLSGAFPSAFSDVPYDRWIAFDLSVIDRCTHVLMLPRWETSTGARLEKAYAESRGIPVVLYSPTWPEEP